MVANLLVSLVMGVVLFAFFLYHVKLASTNVTTNETFKFSNMRYMIDEENRKRRERFEAAKKAVEEKPNSAKAKQAYAKAKDELDELEVEGNAYDRGIVQNWKEVIWPLSLRNTNEAAVKEAGQGAGEGTEGKASRKAKPPQPSVIERTGEGSPKDAQLKRRNPKTKKGKEGKRR